VTLLHQLCTLEQQRRLRAMRFAPNLRDIQVCFIEIDETMVIGVQRLIAGGSEEPILDGPSSAAKKDGRTDVSPPSGSAGPSATNRDHAISEIVFGSGGEDPIGGDLQDAERLLDQGRCDAAPAHRSDNTARGLPLASNA
jgi:hypothetical protein